MVPNHPVRYRARRFLDSGFFVPLYGKIADTATSSAYQVSTWVAANSRPAAGPRTKKGRGHLVNACDLLDQAMTA
jgi:hypothetical protein